MQTIFHIYPLILVTWPKAATMKADEASEVWTKREGDAPETREGGVRRPAFTAQQARVSGCAPRPSFCMHSSSVRCC